MKNAVAKGLGFGMWLIAHYRSNISIVGSNPTWYYGKGRIWAAMACNTIQQAGYDEIGTYWKHTLIVGLPT